MNLLSGYLTPREKPALGLRVRSIPRAVNSHRNCSQLPCILDRQVAPGPSSWCTCPASTVNKGVPATVAWARLLTPRFRGVSTERTGSQMRERRLGLKGQVAAPIDTFAKTQSQKKRPLARGRHQTLQGLRIIQRYDPLLPQSGAALRSALLPRPAECSLPWRRRCSRVHPTGCPKSS